MYTRETLYEYYTGVSQNKCPICKSEENSRNLQYFLSLSWFNKKYCYGNTGGGGGGGSIKNFVMGSKKVIFLTLSQEVF